MSDLSQSKILNIIDDVYLSGAPAIIRSGFCSEFGLNEWIALLKKKWTHDTRHFTHESNLMKSDWWEITNRRDLEHTYAYSNTPQPFHTDNAWFENPPEINLFVMQRQAMKGGEQLIYLLDDLIVDLKNADPYLYKKLISTDVIIKKGDEDFFNRTKIIMLGERNSIYWNYYRTIKENHDISDMVESFFRFLESRRDSKNVIKVKLHSGDCLVMNDVQSLHAREGFEVSEDGQRSLLQSMWKKDK